MPTRATLFDGVSAQGLDVRVRPDGSAVAVERADGDIERIDPGLLVRVESPGAPRFGRSDIAGWRLRFAEEPEPELAALLPRTAPRFGRWVDRIGLLPAAGAFALAAAAVVAIGYAAPAWVAPLIPEQWERDLGTALVGDFGDLRCTEPASNEALSLLAERLEPGITSKGEGAVRFTAINVDLFNAAALPGGQIVLFKEMLTEADAGAVAGVVAHEIAHVRRRHVTQALVREQAQQRADAGQLVALSYTRANEEEADRDAIAMLRRAGIDPRPTARLFAKLSKDMGEGRRGMFDAEFLQSHPVSRERARRFAASYDPGRAYRPVLTRDQADALIDTCWVRPDKEKVEVELIRQ